MCLGVVVACALRRLAVSLTRFVRRLGGASEQVPFFVFFGPWHSCRGGFACSLAPPPRPLVVSFLVFLAGVCISLDYLGREGSGRLRRGLPGWAARQDAGGCSPSMHG